MDFSCIGRSGGAGPLVTAPGCFLGRRHCIVSSTCALVIVIVTLEHESCRFLSWRRVSTVLTRLVNQRMAHQGAGISPPWSAVVDAIPRSHSPSTSPLTDQHAQSARAENLVFFFDPLFICAPPICCSRAGTALGLGDGRSPPRQAGPCLASGVPARAAVPIVSDLTTDGAILVWLIPP